MKTDFKRGGIDSVIDSCHRATSIPEFKNFFCSDFRELIPHEMSAIGIIETDTLRVRRIINLDFPKGYIDQTVDTTGTLLCPAAKAWSCSLAPQFFDIDDIRNQASHKYTDAFHRFDVQNIASYGIMDLASNIGSYFSFGRLYNPNREQVRNTLELVIPHFHMTLARILLREVDYTGVLGMPNAQPPAAASELYRQLLAPLSARESEVLTWLCYGKSNGEIATILNVSIFTIKNHVQNILLKLSANNRSHAVWRAMDMGLVSVFAPRREGLPKPPLAR